MVVEDHRATRDAVAAILRSNGYAVMPVRDGARALTVLESIKPDLIFLDMLMPILDGWGFLERLKGTPHEDVPVVVTTGTILTHEWAGQHGCAGFLKKPVDDVELLAEYGRHSHGQRVDNEAKPIG